MNRFVQKGRFSKFILYIDELVEKSLASLKREHRDPKAKILDRSTGLPFYFKRGKAMLTQMAINLEAAT